jgi:HD-GYP domain-containing protein (c-di-GMP phosphodiesterase class II)
MNRAQFGTALACLALIAGAVSGCGKNEPAQQEPAAAQGMHLDADYTGAGQEPGALSDAEFDIIKQHPVAGARILRSVPFLVHHIPIVELHHERPDGRGYPHGLRADEIPMPARIVHVADAYDAITSKRAYRGARPSGEALREIWRFAGTEFHAEVVGALATALPGVTSAGGEVSVEQMHA